MVNHPLPQVVLTALTVEWLLSHSTDLYNLAVFADAIIPSSRLRNSTF
jgi:hypothetical protein